MVEEQQLLAREKEREKIHAERTKSSDLHFSLAIDHDTRPKVLRATGPRGAYFNETVESFEIGPLLLQCYPHLLSAVCNQRFE